MPYGLKLGAYHTLDVWNMMLLRGWSISPAPVNRYTLKIPGADGQYDLTKSLTGRVTYGNRTGTFTFKCIAPREQWDQIYHDFLNTVNGQTLDIVTDTDPGHYYTGFISVGDMVAIKNDAFRVKVTAYMEPFKWEQSIAEYTLNLAGLNTTEEAAITVGENVSQNPWNTDLRYGTQSIPIFDFSLFSAIKLTWTGASGTLAVIQFVDGAGNYYQEKVSHSVGELTVTTATLKENGVEPSTIWRILVSFGTDVTVTGQTIAAKMDVASGERCKDVVVEVPEGVDLMAFEGKQYELVGGLNSAAQLELKKGINTILFMSSTAYLPSEGMIKLRLRRGWQ